MWLCGVSLWKTTFRRKIFVVGFLKSTFVTGMKLFFSGKSIFVALSQFVIEEIGMFSPWVTA